LALNRKFTCRCKCCRGCGWGTEMEYAVPVVLVGFIALDALVIWLLAG
jgi:hypothetical protein